MGTRILVVDDEQLIRWSLKESLAGQGYEVAEAADGAEAMAALAKGNFGAALLDYRLPDTDGIALMHAVHKTHPDLPVLIITAYSSIEGAVGAVKAGAVDYVTKPFNMEDLVLRVARAIERKSMARTLKANIQEKQEEFGLHKMAGEHPRLREVKDLILKVARGGGATTVLLLGESGTGKDMAARAIHYESDRVTHPFMNITCTALPQELLESELFGYEAGAFTDARSRKKGLFELADQGSIFLDEIGDMAATLQAKLLRFLEEKRFRRISGSVDIEVDVRIIAATNQDLAQLVEDRSFREDLYYRLNIVPIVMPSLRERPEDIPLLAEHFVERFRREFRKACGPLSPGAFDKLVGYPWPGNVRELRNVLERAVLLHSGDSIDPDDILLGRAALQGTVDVSGPMGGLPENCTLAEAERILLLRALERTRWNQSKAAALLDISRDQVRYKMGKHGLAPPDSAV